MKNKEMLLDFQNRIEIILDKGLDPIEGMSLSTTYGWVNACLKFNNQISQDDADSIREEISICEELCEAY